MSDLRYVLAVATLALVRDNAPAFAVVVSLIAFGVALYALHRVEDVVKSIDNQATEQANEISELVADPSNGGEMGSG